MSILELTGVESGYGEVQILWGISMALKEGGLTSLVGSNGSGKTTLLRAVMGLLPVCWCGVQRDPTGWFSQASGALKVIGLRGQWPG